MHDDGHGHDICFMVFIQATEEKLRNHAMTTLLIRNGTVVTCDAGQRVLRDHGVFIEDSRIRRIAPTTELPREADRVIDARGRVVMPGLVNAHMHFYSTFARGISGVARSREFVEVLQNLWWRLDRKLTLADCHASAIAPLLDGVRHGTTTVIDHHASPGAVDGSLREIARAAGEVGVRAALCYEVSDRDGDEVARAGIAENAAFARDCGLSPSEMLRPMFGLHAAFTLSDETLRQAVRAAEGVGFHVHCAEAQSDQRHSLKAYGMRVVERFQKMGVLGPQTICAHCVHVNQKELDLLASTGTMVVHNPQSNMNNAVGAADLVGQFRSGVTVGLGTDGMTSNMFEAVRVANILQPHNHGLPGAGFEESVSTLMVNNAKIAARVWGDIGIGTLVEGGVADLIVLDYLSPTPLTSETLMGHVAFGFPLGTVDTTVVAGRVLMEQKELKVGLDVERALARSRELAEEFWKRF